VHFARWEAEMAEQTADRGAQDSADDSSRQAREKAALIAKVTLEADRQAAGHLTALLVPLVIGAALRSLIVDKHLSWYSWFIGALTGSV